MCFVYKYERGEKDDKAIGMNINKAEIINDMLAEIYFLNECILIKS